MPSSSSPVPPSCPSLSFCIFLPLFWRPNGWFQFLLPCLLLSLVLYGPAACYVVVFSKSSNGIKLSFLFFPVGGEWWAPFSYSLTSLEGRVLLCCLGATRSFCESFLLLKRAFPSPPASFSAMFRVFLFACAALHKERIFGVFFRFCFFRPANPCCFFLTPI